MSRLRLVGGVFAILWIVYGILKMDNPIIVINSFIVVIHLHWFYKNRNGAGAGGKVDKGKFIDSSQNSFESQTSSESGNSVVKRFNKNDYRNRKLHGIEPSHIDFMWNWIREKSGK